MQFPLNVYEFFSVTCQLSWASAYRTAVSSFRKRIVARYSHLHLLPRRTQHWRMSFRETLHFMTWGPMNTACQNQITSVTEVMPALCNWPEPHTTSISKRLLSADCSELKIGLEWWNHCNLKSSNSLCAKCKLILLPSTMLLFLQGLI